VAVYSIAYQNKSSILNFRGGYRWQSKYPWCTKEVKSKNFLTVYKRIGKNKKKVTEKQEFLCKTSFQQNRFFYPTKTRIAIST